MEKITEGIKKKVHEWIKYAEEDLELAKIALASDKICPYRLVAYHAQQFTEKYLKGYLILNSIIFPYTHDISILLKLCKLGNLSNSISIAKNLTPYGTFIRYPGFQDDVLMEEAIEAVDIASKIKEVIIEEINKKVILG